MKKFEITCIKVNKFKMNNTGPAFLTKQIIETDKDVFDYPTPPGYELISVCQLLPDIKLITSKIN